MRFKRSLLINAASAALVISAATGCASWKAREGGRSFGRVIDDRQVTKRVEHQLKASPVYKYSTVDVRTFDGVVQLSGFVNTEDQRRQATILAQRAEGVERVENNILLKPEQGPTPTGRSSGYYGGGGNNTGGQGYNQGSNQGSTTTNTPPPPPQQ